VGVGGYACMYSCVCVRACIGVWCVCVWLVSYARGMQKVWRGVKGCGLCVRGCVLVCVCVRVCRQ